MDQKNNMDGNECVRGRGSVWCINICHKLYERLLTLINENVFVRQTMVILTIVLFQLLLLSRFFGPSPTFEILSEHVYLGFRKRSGTSDGKFAGKVSLLLLVLLYQGLHLKKYHYTNNTIHVWYTFDCIVISNNFSHLWRSFRCRGWPCFCRPHIFVP